MNYEATLVFILVFGVIIGGTEFVGKQFHIFPEITRKVAHTLSAIAGVFAPWYVTKETIFVLSLIFSIFFAIAKRKEWLPSIYNVQRRSLGEITFPLGIGIAALGLLPHNILAFQFGLLILAGADSLANLVGEYYGTHPLTRINSHKTWEGSFTFFLLTWILFGIMSGGWEMPIGVATIGLTSIESVSRKGVDNLILPLIAGWLFIWIL